MGYAHANAIMGGEIEGMTLTAICDIEKQKIENFKSQNTEIAAFSDYTDLFKSGLCDAVVVAVPHKSHALIACDAFEHGLHVLVEKPVDISVSAARRLGAAAEKSGKVFGIMFNQRTNPLFSKAREIVKSGALGEIKRSVWIVTNWYRTQHYYDSGDWRATWAGEGGGVLLNQAPHQLDLWQWICGMPKTITAFCDIAKYHNIEVEDDVTIFARFENGATGLFVTTTGENPGTNRLEISGSLGKLVLENGTLKWWKLGTSEREVCFNSTHSSPHIDTEYEEFHQEKHESAHKGILQNFAAAVLHGEPLLAPGYEGINELTVSNAAYLSAWTGNREIELPFNEAEFDELLSRRMENSTYKKSAAHHKTSDHYRSRWSVNW